MRDNMGDNMSQQVKNRLFQKGIALNSIQAYDVYESFVRNG
jgi:hypothetical protein